MDTMKIKSISGYYYVHFEDNIRYENIVTNGDIVVIDRNVYELYLNQFSEIITNNKMIIIDASETQKSYEGLIPIIDKIINSGFHKNNKLIAIGGGITQDCTAFIASILYRGVDWELIPTTLLAQCDSCIGSKTSINFSSFKNQIGGFYPARNVYISSNFLDSLPKKEIKSGLGEMLHYYIVSGEEDFDFFTEHCMQAMEDISILKMMIMRSLEIKRKYVEVDEYDKNERQIFNYGHSFGHAIEAMTNYDIPHGIAVSYGMDIANYISEKKGILDGSVRRKIRKTLELFWVNGELGGFDINTFMIHLKRDKKNRDNKLGIILCSGFGKLSKYYIDADEKLFRMLSLYFTENSMGGMS